MACGLEIFYGMWRDEMLQRVKAHVWNPGSLYSIPPTHMVDREHHPAHFHLKMASSSKKKEKNRHKTI